MCNVMEESKDSILIPYYRPRGPEFVRSRVGWKTLKREIYRYCCGLGDDETTRINVFHLKMEKIIPEMMPVWEAFEKFGFNFDKFMAEKGYELIEDEELRVEVLMSVCFPLIHQPISKFMIDWLNGYLDFFKRDPELRWEDGSEITDSEILRRLFYCGTEQDIWHLMAKGIGDIKSLYLWYMDQTPDPILEEATGIPCYSEKDEIKAEFFLKNLLKNSIGATEKVRQIDINEEDGL